MCQATPKINTAESWLPTDCASESKVTELDHTTLGNEDVFRFHVTVDNLKQQRRTQWNLLLKDTPNKEQDTERH